MIGIFGGTFDPIHLGHIRPVLETAESLSLESVRMVLCARPPHRKRPVATPELRWQLLKIAVADYPLLLPDDRELKRSGPSYTVDTLRLFREQMPNTTFCLLVGADALVSLDSWHEWKELTNVAHIVVMRRPGWSFVADSGNLHDFIDSSLTNRLQDLRDTKYGKVWFQDVEPQDISASEIRALLTAGESVEGLVGRGVHQYIQESGLYGTK